MIEYGGIVLTVLVLRTSTIRCGPPDRYRARTTCMLLGISNFIVIRLSHRSESGMFARLAQNVHHVLTSREKSTVLRS
jgi:hypothetical protein